MTDVIDRIGEVTAHVGGRDLGTFQLPRDETVTFGRGASCGIRVPESKDASKVSTIVATFIPTPLGWVLQNGQRTRVRAISLFVIEVSLEPRAQLLLQRDVDWSLTWDFDVVTEITLRYRAVGRAQAAPIARDRAPHPRALPSPYVGTAVAGRDLKFTALQRRRLGALFAYLIEERVQPRDLLGTAANLTGHSKRNILNTAIGVRDRINQSRNDQIIRMEDLGYYLVNVAGVLGPDDLLGSGHEKLPIGGQ